MQRRLPFSFSFSLQGSGFTVGMSSTIGYLYVSRKEKLYVRFLFLFVRSLKDDFPTPSDQPEQFQENTFLKIFTFQCTLVRHAPGRENDLALEIDRSTIPRVEIMCI